MFAQSGRCFSCSWFTGGLARVMRSFVLNLESGHGSKPFWDPILGRVNLPPILEPILVGIESDVHWGYGVLTHGQVTRAGSRRDCNFVPFSALSHGRSFEACALGLLAGGTAGLREPRSQSQPPAARCRGLIAPRSCPLVESRPKVFVEHVNIWANQTNKRVKQVAC